MKKDLENQIGSINEDLKNIYLPYEAVLILLGKRTAFQIALELIGSLQQEMWKPSEEQITAAKSAYSVLKSHDTWGEDEHLPILMSLINDLQKLL